MPITRDTLATGKTIDLDALNRESLRACNAARAKGLTGHAAVQFAKVERRKVADAPTAMPITRRYFTPEPVMARRIPWLRIGLAVLVYAGFCWLCWWVGWRV
jgi:hypothetical protein